MGLTFLVSVQYCSLQHWTSRPPPSHPKLGIVHFGFVPSSFLELFLHWPPVAYWAPTDLWSSSFSVLSFCLFGSVHGVLKARILKWLAISFSSEPCFVRTLHHDPSILGSPTQHGSWFHLVRQGCILGGSKITEDGDCSHEIKRCLLLRRKAMTNLDSTLKSRNLTLPANQSI